MLWWGSVILISVSLGLVMIISLGFGTRLSHMQKSTVFFYIFFFSKI